MSDNSIPPGTMPDAFGDGIDYNKSAIGWLVAAYIFAILGGFLGFCIGFSIFRGKVETRGVKLNKYKQPHRIAGLIAGILGVISFVAWKAAVS